MPGLTMRANSYTNLPAINTGEVIMKYFLNFILFCALLSVNSFADEAWDKNPVNPGNAHRYQILERALPKMAKKAAVEFADESGTKTLGKLESAVCPGKKSADVKYPGV